MENYYDVNAPKIDLPNSTIILVLGILSIVCCCGYGVPGVILGIIALILAKSATNLYVANPGKFTEGSYKNMNAGKICAWIGLSLSIVFLVTIIITVYTIGIEDLSDPAKIYERFGIEMP